MRIGALQKQSLIDWEGKIVAVVFTKGCNFRCGYCHNPSLVLPDLLNQTPDIPAAEVLTYLSTRAGWLEGVVITGGEPTIHKDLKQFLIPIKELGFKIKLDTNGTNPLLIEELISERLIDYVAMDVKTVLDNGIYCGLVNYSQTDLVGKINLSIKILREANIEYLLRTTIIPDFHTSGIIKRLQQELSKDNYKLQEFRKGETIERISYDLIWLPD